MTQIIYILFIDCVNRFGFHFIASFVFNGKKMNKINQFVDYIHNMLPKTAGLEELFQLLVTINVPPGANIGVRTQ